ncbi:unnamed protein product [Trichogramma brassicae]|uniref:Uncharacterized protein n=1 Tax=Trichogramma brassicae TaxID=86971 RepID=A0A6H5HTE4_9HYME|nr:unnamed protein product [Trichogramma brassicae]
MAERGPRRGAQSDLRLARPTTSSSSGTLSRLRPGLSPGADGFGSALDLVLAARDSGLGVRRVFRVELAASADYADFFSGASARTRSHPRPFGGHPGPEEAAGSRNFHAAEGPKTVPRLAPRTSEETRPRARPAASRKPHRADAASLAVGPVARVTKNPVATRPRRTARIRASDAAKVQRSRRVSRRGPRVALQPAPRWKETGIESSGAVAVALRQPARALQLLHPQNTDLPENKGLPDQKRKHLDLYAIHLENHPDTPENPPSRRLFVIARGFVCSPDEMHWPRRVARPQPRVSSLRDCTRYKHARYRRARRLDLGRGASEARKNRGRAPSLVLRMIRIRARSPPGRQSYAAFLPRRASHVAQLSPEKSSRTSLLGPARLDRVIPNDELDFNLELRNSRPDEFGLGAAENPGPSGQCVPRLELARGHLEAKVARGAPPRSALWHDTASSPGSSALLLPRLRAATRDCSSSRLQCIYI